MMEGGGTDGEGEGGAGTDGRGGVWWGADGGQGVLGLGDVAVRAWRATSSVGVPLSSRVDSPPPTLWNVGGGEKRVVVVVEEGEQMVTRV